MKRIAAILVSLLIAAAPTLSMAASPAPIETTHGCGGCACNTSACCVEDSAPSPVEQPAVPASSSAQQLSASFLHNNGNLIVLPMLPVPDYAAASNSPSLSAASPFYLRNCAFLI